MAQHPTITYIASHLHDIRTQKRLTQAEVATSAGISTNYYARIERGDTGTSILIMEKIVKALKVTSSDVLPF